MNGIIGIGIVVITAWLILKKHDMRVILLASGLLMAGIALDPLTALDEFARKMVTDSLIHATCSVLGFAFVMKQIGCQDHLIRLAGPWCRKMGFLLIPLATLLTFAINAILMSAANTAAVAGVLLIPLMRAVGIHPAMAASAVLAGTFGSMLNPKLAVNAFVARIGGVSCQVVADGNTLPVLLSLLAAASGLTILALKMKPEPEPETFESQESAPTAEPSPLFAMIPLVPLSILLLGAGGIIPPLRMGVAQSMVVGALLGVAITRTSPSEVTGSFFDGMGKAYADMMGLIIAVAVFVRGMKSIGLISLWITGLTTTPALARVGGGLGPFLLGIVSGSGDAAAFAFNDAVAPHAVQFGMSTVNMGSMAAIAGALGRTLSPLSGAAIICSAIAGISPMELTRKNAPGLCAALVITCLIL